MQPRSCVCLKCVWVLIIISLDAVARLAYQGSCALRRLLYHPVEPPRKLLHKLRCPQICPDATHCCQKPAGQLDSFLLQEAALCGHVACVQALMSMGFKPSSLTLSYLAYSSSLCEVQWFVEEVHVGSLDLAMASAVRNRRYEVALYLKQRGCPTLDEGLVSGAPDDALVWAAHNQILKENDAISRRLVAAFMRGVMVKAVRHHAEESAAVTIQEAWRSQYYSPSSPIWARRMMRQFKGDNGGSMHLTDRLLWFRLNGQRRWTKFLIKAHLMLDKVIKTHLEL